MQSSNTGTPSRDNGKETGNYYSIMGLHCVYMGIMEKKVETRVFGPMQVSIFCLKDSCCTFGLRPSLSYTRVPILPSLRGGVGHFYAALEGSQGRGLGSLRLGFSVFSSVALIFSNKLDRIPETLEIQGAVCPKMFGSIRR